jgi:hypothetical protein
MAESNKWNDYVAACPHCGLPIGVMISDGLHAVGGLILVMVTTLQCWNPYCRRELTYRPRALPVALPGAPSQASQPAVL